MTAFSRSTRFAGIAGVLLPLLVGAALVFSAIVLADSSVLGQQTSDDRPPQATAPHPSEADWLRGFSTAISAVAGPGFAVWYAWYMTTRRIPEIELAHKSTIDRMQVEHSAEVKSLIENFRADIRSLWDQKRADDAAFRDALKELRQSVSHDN